MNKGAKVSIGYSNFINNTSGKDGGAISSKGALKVYDSFFVGNKAEVRTLLCRGFNNTVYEFLPSENIFSLKSLDT